MYVSEIVMVKHSGGSTGGGREGRGVKPLPKITKYIYKKSIIL